MFTGLGFWMASNPAMISVLVEEQKGPGTAFHTCRSPCTGFVRAYMFSLKVQGSKLRERSVWTMPSPPRLHAGRVGHVRLPSVKTVVMFWSAPQALGLSRMHWLKGPLNWSTSCLAFCDGLRVGSRALKVSKALVKIASIGMQMRPLCF